MVGTVVGVGASLIGSSMQAGAASDAAAQEAASADAAVAEQRRQYDLTRQDQLPFYNTGVSANQRLAYLMGLNPAALPSTPTTAVGTPTTPTAPTAGNTTPAATQGAPAPLSLEDWKTQNSLKGDTTNRQREQWLNYVKSFPGWSNYGMKGFSGQFSPLTAGSNMGGYYGGTPGASPSAPSTASPYAAPAANPNDPAFGSLAKPFGMSDFQTDPGYEFRMSEGQKALERSAAAKGGLLSGAAVKAATRFGQDTASAEYGNAFNRYTTNQTNLYNRLAGLAGTGQTSANTLANAGQNTANNISNTLTDRGSAQAAGTVGSANAWTTGLNNIASSFNRPSTGTLPWQTPGNVNPAGGFY